MKVTITRENIANGVRRSLAGCPLALAVGEVEGVFRVEVAIYTAQINGRGIVLPPEISRFICRFDDGLPCEPLECELPDVLY